MFDIPVRPARCRLDRIE